MPDFICPNCSHTKASKEIFQDPAWSFGVGKPTSPWEFVFQSLTCAKCYK